MELSEQSKTIRLTVIDDHPIVFLGIRMALRKYKTKSIVLVNQYLDGAEVIKNLANLNSDVVLIDLQLPDISGSDLAKKILEVYPEMKIGIYTSTLDKDSILNSFKSGALGYITKSADYSEIIDFILTIYKGERYVRGNVANTLFQNMLFVDKPQKLILTNREKEIMQLILDGYKTREIAKKLIIAERTVEFHKQNIYLKFDVKSSAELFKAAQSLHLITDKVTFLE